MGQQHKGRKNPLAGTACRRLCPLLAILAILAILAAVHVSPATADRLDQIRERGVLRHLGIPYARFVTGSGDGLDVELIKLFAASLDLEYEFVPTTWKGGFGDLTGKDMQSGKTVPVRGDILASGITILPWRKKLVSFTTPVFISQVWLVARADDALDPIQPGRDMFADIEDVKAKLRGRSVTGVAFTCLDPALYGLEAAGARIRYFSGRLNDLAPFVIDTDAGLALLDVPDSLVAMEKWPGQLKVIGPVTPPQKMGVAVSKDAESLGRAFDLFFISLNHQGRYQGMVEHYYPGYAEYFPLFFSSQDQGPARPDQPGELQ